MSDYKAKPKPPTNALGEFTLRWTAPPEENAVVRFDKKQEPTLSVRVKDNRPGFIVRTNIEGDRDYGKIEADTDSNTFFTILETMRTIAEDEEFRGAYEFECKGYFWGPQGRSEKPGVKAAVVVGRDSEGVLFISVTSGKRPRIKFAIRPSQWFGVKLNGEDVSRAKMSSLYAKGQVNLLSKLVAQILEKEFVSYEQIKQRKEAAKQNRGGGGGGYQKPQASQAPAEPKSDFDEDIPW